MLMIANISLHHCRRHGIPHRPHKTPIFPKLSLPQVLHQLQILFEHLTRRNTIQDPHHLGNRMPGRKIQQDSHMFLNHFQFDQLKTKVFGNLPKHLLHSASAILPNDPSPIFQGLDQMIFRVINGMASTFDGHLPRLSLLGPASSRLNFSSPSKVRGLQFHFSERLVKKGKLSEVSR